MDNSGEAGVVRRVAVSYAADLVALITGVMIGGRLLLPWTDGVASQDMVPWAFADAIDRFTPFGLWHVYRDIVVDAIQAYAHTGAGGPIDAFWVSLQMIGSIFVAIPLSVWTLYQQSDGIYAWGCIGAFVLTLAAFVLSIWGGRRSPARLMLAALLAPVATSLMFWLAQQTMLDAVDGLNWFARMIPWCLPCPVICTLWWVLFPRAPHGATATLLLSLQQFWVSHVRRRKALRHELAGSRPH